MPGNYTVSGGQRPLAARWDGSKWSLVSLPAKEGVLPQSAAYDLSCASASSCVAVGRYLGLDSEWEEFEEPLSWGWNGTAWALQPAPTPPSGDPQRELAGVSCSSSVQCTAVGALSAAPGSKAPWVARWG